MLLFFRTPASDDRSDCHATTSTLGQAHRLLVQLSGQEKHGEKNRGDADRRGEKSQWKKKKNPRARSQNVIAVGKTYACDKHFLYVVRCTAWVLTHCPLLHSSRVFGCTQRNGQIKLWVMLTQNLQTFRKLRVEHPCGFYTPVRLLSCPI